MNKYLKYIIILGAVIAVIVGFHAIKDEKVVVEEDLGRAITITQPKGTIVPLTLLSATTTNATSSSYMVYGAKKITWFFQRGGLVEANTGTSTFRVQVSNTSTSTQDDTSTLNWITYNRLIDNVTNSISQNLTRVGSVIFSAAANYDNATGTSMYSMDLETDTIGFVRCGVNEGTDGEHSCKAIIEY